MGESQVTVRFCKCGCGQVAKKHYASDGQFKAWRSYARGHAPNEIITIKIPESEVDLAYMAGIVDGEGCIHARQNRPSTYLCLQIQMCSDVVLHWVSSKFGGTIYSTPSYNTNHQHKYLWRVNGKALGPLLVALQPYLKEKKLRAKAAIRLSELILGNRNQSPHALEWEERARLIAEIKRYNRAGSGESS